MTVGTAVEDVTAPEFTTHDLLAVTGQVWESCLAHHPDVLVEGPFAPLDFIKQKAGKIVHAWACEGDFDPATLKSNTFRIQWPPRSGKWISVPEVDQAAWFDPATALWKIHKGQQPILRDAVARLGIEVLPKD